MFTRNTTTFLSPPPPFNFYIYIFFIEHFFYRTDDLWAGSNLTLAHALIVRYIQREFTHWLFVSNNHVTMYGICPVEVTHCDRWPLSAKWKFWASICFSCNHFALKKRFIYLFIVFHFILQTALILVCLWFCCKSFFFIGDFMRALINEHFLSNQRFHFDEGFEYF